MKIPSEIKVGGHIYKVHFPYNFIETEAQSKIRLNSKEIMLGKDDVSGLPLPQSSIWVNFIEEVLRAVDRLNGRSVFEKQSSIESCAETIYQILVDNGWLKIKSANSVDIK